MGEVEKVRASAIIDIIHSGENLSITDKAKSRMPTQGLCKECGYISSQDICKACVMLTGLNKGLPQLGIGKSSKHKKPLQELLESSRSTSVACLTNGSGCTDSIKDVDQSNSTCRAILTNGTSCTDSTNNLEQSKSTCTANLTNGTS